jgi:hypothetical protein
MRLNIPKKQYEAGHFVWEHIAVRLLAIIFVLFSVVPAALANDTFLSDNGYTVYPINTDAVRMVSEHIKATINKGHPSAVVQCDFVFKNTAGETVKALVGFPTRVYDPSEESTSKPFSYFESTINGRSAPVRLRKEIVSDMPAATDDSHSKEKHPLRYWYTWEVVFPPHKKLRLHNRYSTSFSTDSVSGQWFEYILTTGANWKGPIGHVIVEVSYESKDDLWDRVVKVSPEGFTIKENTIKWEFRNHVPRQNIKVDERRDKFREFDGKLIPLMDRKPYEGAIRLYKAEDMRIADKALQGNVKKEASRYVDRFYTIDRLIEHLRRLYVRLLRNEIFARHGRTFESRDMRVFFDPWREKYPDRQGVYWYRQNPDYSDSLLNETERKNVQFILDYEKKMGWR